MVVVSVAKQGLTVMIGKSKRVSYFLLALMFDLVLV